MFKDAWNGRLELAKTDRAEWALQLKAADGSILELVDRIGIANVHH